MHNTSKDLKVANIWQFDTWPQCWPPLVLGRTFWSTHNNTTDIMIALIVQHWTQSCTVVLWRSLCDLKYCAFGKHCCQRHTKTCLFSLTITVIALQTIIFYKHMHHKRTTGRDTNIFFKMGIRAMTNNYFRCQIADTVVYFFVNRLIV